MPLLIRKPLLSASKHRSNQEPRSFPSSSSNVRPPHPEPRQLDGLRPGGPNRIPDARFHRPSTGNTTSGGQLHRACYCGCHSPVHAPMVRASCASGNHPKNEDGAGGRDAGGTGPSWIGVPPAPLTPAVPSGPVWLAFAARTCAAASQAQREGTPGLRECWGAHRRLSTWKGKNTGWWPSASSGLRTRFRAPTSFCCTAASPRGEHQFAGLPVNRGLYPGFVRLVCLRNRQPEEAWFALQLWTLAGWDSTHSPKSAPAQGPHGIRLQAVPSTPTRIGPSTGCRPWSVP